MPLEVCFSPAVDKKVGRVAGCLPDVQGMSVDSLWDSGASAGLITHETAITLERNGAVREPVA